MNKQFKIYDPINMRIHYLNFNELRMWVDVSTLQKTIESIKEYNVQFQRLSPEKRESLLSFLDRNENTPKFTISKIRPIPGIELVFDARIIYDSQLKSFHDNTKQSVLDNIFYNKKISTLHLDTALFIDDVSFPVKSICAVSQDFYMMKPLDADVLIPVYDRYIGNESEGDTKLMLNKESVPSPVSVWSQVYRDDLWSIDVMVTVNLTVDWTGILFPNIPNIKHIYDFFGLNGFSPKGDGIKSVRFEKENTVVEYFKSNPHYYQPFLLIKQVDGHKDIKSKQEYGEELKQTMLTYGLFEKISFYRGNTLLVDALDKLSTRTKSLAIPLLDDAIYNFNLCDDILRNESLIEIIYSLWIKSKIYEKENNMNKCIELYKEIILIFKEYHDYNGLLNFLDIIYLNQKTPANLIKHVFPISLIDRDYFINDKNYNRLKQYFNFYCENAKCPSDMSLSEWNYKLAIESIDFSLLKIGKERLKQLFKEIIKNPMDIFSIYEFNENLLNYSQIVGLTSSYQKFATKIATILYHQRKNKSIEDLSRNGRKNYRWELFNHCVLEGFLSYEAAYLKSKINNKATKEINFLYEQSYDAFCEALIHLDYSNKFTDEQFKLIGYFFDKFYTLAYFQKNDECTDFIKEKCYLILNEQPSLVFYELVQQVFYADESIRIAEDLVDTFVAREIEENGIFTLNQENTLKLSKLYILAKEYEEASKTIDKGLEEVEWSLETLEQIYELEPLINSSGNDYNEDLIHVNNLYEIIESLAGSLQDFASYTPELFHRINKLTSL